MAIFLSILPSSIWAKDIKLSTKAKTDCRRTTFPIVTADIDITCLNINISKYNGYADIFIYDSYGSMIAQEKYDVTFNEGIIWDIGGLLKGEYTLVVSFSSVLYIGDFEIK